MDRVDVIVIGSGQGGVPFATAMAREGRSVLLFERGAFGGSCVNTGCTPSKAFLASAEAAGMPRHAQGLGVQLRARVDGARVMERVRRMAAQQSNGVRQRLERAGVRIAQAEAAFAGIRQVAGGGLTVEAPLIVIDTGSSPAVPDIPGLSDTPYTTDLTFWSRADLPRRAIILGAGYTGLELGQGLARLGSDVHLVDLHDRPLHSEEEDVSRVLGEALYADGVRFHLSTGATSVQHHGDTFRVTLENGDTLEGDLLLVATGRRPNTEALNCDAGNIALDAQGYIVTDDQLRTTCEGVYAIGDVIGQPAFTHVSWEDHRRLLGILSGEGRRKGDRTLAYVFFSDPQVGRVGLTLEQAREQGISATAATMALEQVARSSETGRSDGFMRLVVSEDDGHILGATLVGPAAGELVHVILAHMESGNTWRALDQSVHVHPTYAEGLPSLARQIGRQIAGRTREARA